MAWPEVLTAKDNIVSMEKSILNRSIIHRQIMTAWVYICLFIQIHNREMLSNIITYIYWFFFFLNHTHTFLSLEILCFLDTCISEECHELELFAHVCERSWEPGSVSLLIIKLCFSSFRGGMSESWEWGMEGFFELYSQNLENLIHSLKRGVCTLLQFWELLL